MAGPVNRSLLARLGVAAGLLVSANASTQCLFDQFNEIVNPFAPGCGDVRFTYTENDSSGLNIALGFPPPLPVASLTAVDGFREYASLHMQHQALMIANPDEVAGTIVGQTLSGRDIWAYRIGDTADQLTVDGLPEPAVMVNTGTHAREWQTPEASTELFETLIETKADGGVGQYLAENLNVVILPVLNIDGFIQTQNFALSVTADPGQPRDGRMRRKNLRNPVSLGLIDADLATVGDNFWGVDLNRNSPIGFGLNNGSWGQGRETSLIFRSLSTVSEPEILALQNGATLGPADRLRMYTDIHAFTQIYFTPLTGNTRRDNITVALMNRMRVASPRIYRDGRDGPGEVGNQGIGTTADYFAYTFQIPSWTLETEPLNGAQDYGGTSTHGHSGFILPDDEVARMRDDVTNMLWLGFYRQAAPPRIQAVQISEAATGDIVYAASWVAAGGTDRTLSVTSNNALVPGGDYRLWLAFNKPMRWRNAGGTIVRFRGQTVDGATGSARLELPTVAGEPTISIPINTASAWLDQPGGAPNGFLRYADDALVADFSIAADLDISGAVPAVLAIGNLDFAVAALDANPATAVDWSNGAWINYEDQFGVAGDIGGVDCTLQVFVAPNSTDPAPAESAVCAAAVVPPPSPPPPPSGGGGGSLGWLLGLLLMIGWSSAGNGPGNRR